MIDDLLLGLGLVAIVEGLALALAPSRLRDLLEALDRIGPDARRLIGLLAITIGLVLIWISRS
jgi:uncharacterized protein YjeT (DUF2065 family)